MHEFAALGDYLVDQGYAVGLLAMHHDQDDTIARAVDAHMRGDSFVIADAYDTPTLFSIFDNAFVVVGMRLHALIIGAALDKRVMAISYDPKVDSFMKMIHNPHCVALGDVSEDVLIKNAAERLEIDRPEVDHRVRAHQTHQPHAGKELSGNSLAAMMQVMLEIRDAALYNRKEQYHVYMEVIMWLRSSCW